MSKIYFEKLTPVKDLDLNIYKDALDFAFGDREITNIAITGSYSAGKSSVIESYKEKVKDKKFLHISLANFEKEELKEGSNTTEKSINEAILEGKILNQLLHQIDTSNIPQTNFKVKKTVPDKDIIKITAMTVVFILSGLHIFYNKKWVEFVKSLEQFYSLRFLQITTKGISLFFSGVIFLTIFSIAIFYFIKMQKNKIILKKLNFKGNEIEIFEKSDESYFDKYLNEVLYLFENSGADVIVFEDIDRYNINQIFQRLREINILVNSKRIINKKEPLRFLYLLRDDIFLSKDRTKFFDFIMPVVPVVDSSNSYDRFIDHFEKQGILDKFDEHFLQGISLYVDDMRILKNIYNEFIVYYDRIGTTEQDYNKLLAIIVYKNIFPHDFSDTQINKGFVSTIFASKEKLIEKEKNEINTEIQKLENKIEKCENEQARTIHELDLIYTRYNYYGNNTVDRSNSEYIERKENIELKQDNKLSEIKDKIEILKNEKSKLNDKKLSEIITRENINRSFDINYENFLEEENDFNYIKSSQYFDLIKYLIRNGYIDETYQDYMTYFYPNSLTTNDKMFLRSITDKKSKDWTYKIENPKLVLSRLRKVDFYEIETLNFSLFDYILRTQDINKEYLDIFINQLKESKQLKFLKEYFTVTKCIEIFVKTINKYWYSFLEEINSCSEFTYQERKKYILITLYNDSKKIIESINKDKFLSNVISSDKLFLSIENPETEKLIEQFISINVKFEILDFENSNKKLFESVYKNSLYKINYENISVILKNVFKHEDENEIKYKNYSLIMQNSNSELAEYINENIQLYIEMVINNCNGKILDNQETALKLINNEEIEINSKIEYIKLLKTQLQYLKDVSSIGLWDLLLQNKKVEYSMDNILKYYFSVKNPMNEVLIDFINSDNIVCDFSEKDISKTFGEGSAGDLFESIVSCEDIKEENYKIILSRLDFTYSYPEEGLQNLSEEKMSILVDLNKFEVTSENIEFLKANFKKIFILFITKNINEYIEKIENLPKLEKDELIALLSTEIDDEYKVKLISYFNQPISISGLNCSDYIKEYILNNNFDESELEYIISLYENCNDSIKTTIHDICRNYITTIINEKLKVSYKLFVEILKIDNLNNEMKLSLLNNHIERLSKQETFECVKIIGLKEHEKIFNNGRPKIEVSDVNKAFLNMCKKRAWISNFNEEEGVFKISRKGLLINT